MPKGATFNAVMLPQPGLPEQDQWDGLTVAMLKHELQKRSLPTKGIKHKLVARLRESVAANIKPGTAGIGGIATKEVSRRYIPPTALMSKNSPFSGGTQTNGEDACRLQPWSP